MLAAVSGGSDSLALLVVLQRWLRTAHSEVDLLCVTVDHGLRSESLAEAEAVADLCARQGIRHRVMRWADEKPKAGIAAAGREARYRLLAEAARDAGTDIVVTGHTADDQAETVAMRRMRGDGRGLAGMAPATLFEGRTWILRPLLDARREDLRNMLRTAGVDWFDDPTNHNPAYERPRVRREVSASVDELAEEARAAGHARTELGLRAAELIAQHASSPMRGLVNLSPNFLQAEEEAALYAFRALLAVAGGVTHLPDAGRSAELLQRFRDGRKRATLSRSVADLRKGGLFIYREARDLPAESDGLWDNRYRIGVAGAARSTGDSNEVPASVARAVAVSNPSFTAEVMPTLAPWRLFLPGFDLVLAQVIARLIGACGFPESPYREHNGKEA